MSRIRVLHVYRTYFPDPPGGIQEAIRQIAISTSTLAIETRIFVLSPKPQPAAVDRPEAHVTRCLSWANPASCDLGWINSFRCFSDAVKWADIINYHFPWPFADLLHFAIRPTVPAIMTYHSDIVRQKWLGRAYTPLMRCMLREMRIIVATSPAYARTSLVLSDELVRDRVRIIPLGINEYSYPQFEDDKLLSRIGLDDEKSFFLFIGVLRYYKGLHTLIQAAATVRAQLVIAGTGPEYDSLQNQAQQLNLSNIIFCGQVSNAEKVTLIKHCRAVVLPSHLRSEAYGMVLVEAAMFGKPMISCEIGTGTSFVNAGGETGFVISPENPAELARVMNHILENTDLANKFSYSARLRYTQIFSGEILGQAYAALYREVVVS